MPRYLDLIRGTSYSALGLLNICGVKDFYATNVKGVNADMFVEMVKYFIVPNCKPFPGPDSVVVMDNATIHRDPRVRRLIEDTGARLYFLPAYANNLNPIEEAFSKLKRYLERHRELENEPLYAISSGFASITSKDTRFPQGLLQLLRKTRPVTSVTQVIV